MKELNIKNILQFFPYEEESLKIGYWIQLKDLVSEDLKNSVFFSSKIQMPIDVVKYSERDFRSIFLCSFNENRNILKIYSKLHRVLSLSTFQITNIIKDVDDNIYVILNGRLAINLFSSGIISEFQLLDTQVSYQVNKLDIEFLDELLSDYENYELGLFTNNELMTQQLFRVKYYINYTQNKWEIKNVQPMFRGPI